MKLLTPVCAAAVLALSAAAAVAQTVQPAATDAVALGNGSMATEANTVSIGNGGAAGATGPAQRRITQVADGVGATDAVNVRQLTGAIAGIDPRDQIARDAAAAAQTSANNAQTSANNAQADATKALTGDANDRIARNSAAHAQTTADNAQTTATAAQSTANAAQASATHAHQRIDEVDRKASRGIAAALATAAAMPAGTDLEPGQTAMNIGFGSYSNYGAAAIGFARRIKTEDSSLINGAVVRGAVAVTGGRPAVSVGMGWKW